MNKQPCKGLNCGTTTAEHSPECLAEYAAALCGGTFTPKSKPAAPQQFAGQPSIAACILGAEAAGNAIDGRTAAKVYSAMQKAMWQPPAGGEPELQRYDLLSQFNSLIDAKAQDVIRDIDENATYTALQSRLQAAEARVVEMRTYIDRLLEDPRMVVAMPSEILIKLKELSKVKS